jgi:type IV pilus assembly protein PilB
MADDAPVVQVVNLIVTQALRDRASDIHIEPQGDRVRVRYRIDGALHDAIDPLPGNMAAALTSRIKILAGMNIVERRRPQDGQISMEIDGRPIDIRVSTVATIWGEACVMRVLDKSRSLFRLGELGMPNDTHEEFARLIRAPFGMVIAAGPTGSGKTTTLYAALSEIDEPHRNIMTIEDPVEYVFPTINQIQTHEQAGITFSTGLRSILRQDPDVILVGEVRDVDTARVAVQSALTGHFVLSSLHATDCAAALHRFLDMGIESFLIASSVLAVVSQRLVRRICPSCKEPFNPKDEDLAFYEESGGEPKDTFWRGAGCNFCADTGYRDRIGVYELMKITPEIRRLIVGWATQEELQRMAINQGMRTLRDEAISLISQDVTTISEVVRSIYAA